MSDPSPRSKILFGFALLTTLTMLPLIFVGGTVTSRDAGMAFPDAPLSNGSLINPDGWLVEIDKFWEHTHRLIGWVVGMLAIATVLASFVVEKRKWVRLMAIGGLFGITAQGIMGIYRVQAGAKEASAMAGDAHEQAIMDPLPSRTEAGESSASPDGAAKIAGGAREVSTTFATIHGVWGQLCLAWMACLVLVTSGGWRRRLERVSLSREEGSAIRRSMTFLVLAVVLQIGLGSYTRHGGALGGTVLHVFWGIVTAYLIMTNALWLGRSLKGVAWIRRGAVLLIILLVAQLTLGLATFMVTGGSSAHVYAPRFSQWAIPTGHVVGGALILSTTAVLTALCYRTLPPEGASVTSNPSTMETAAA